LAALDASTTGGGRDSLAAGGVGCPPGVLTTWADWSVCGPNAGR
jgi:hypothetical protein